VSTIAILNTVFTANVKGFSEGTDKVKKGLGSVAARVKGVSGSVAGFAAALGGSAIVGTLVSITKASMENADSLGELSAKIGLSVKSLSELQYVAQLSDVEFGTLANAVKKLQINLVEAAATGKGGTAAALDQLGLSAANLVTALPNDQLFAIADSIAAVGNPAEQAALAMDIFGKAGVDLLPMLQGGAAGMRELIKEAHATGSVLDDVTANKINAANDAWDKIGKTIEGFGNKLAVNVAPIITQLGDDLLKTGIDGELAAGQTASGFGSIIPVIAFAADAAELFWRVFQVGAGQFQVAVGLVLKQMSLIPATLDWIMEKITGTSTGIGAMLSESGDELMERGREKWGAVGQYITGETKSWGEQFQNYSNTATAAADSVNAAVARTPVAMQAATDATVKATEAAKEYVEKLKLERDTFGMTTEQVERYKLAQQGAAASVLKEAAMIAGQIDALEKQKKAVEDAAKAREETLDRLRDKASSVLEEIQTPQEKYNAKIAELNELFRTGHINLDQFQRASKKAFGDSFGDKPKIKAMEPMKFADGLQRGTQGARSAILASVGQSAKTAEDRIEGHTKRMADGINRMNTQLSTLVKLNSEEEFVK